MNTNDIANKVIGMKEYNLPWQHAVEDNFLDDTYYAEICKMIDITNTGMKEGPGHAVNNQTIIEICEITDYKDFWQDFIEKFSSNIFLEAIKEKCKISGKFDLIRHDIHRCEKGFNLSAHNDVKVGVLNEMASLQIYCA